MQTLYHIALVIHIIGLSMMAGTTVVDYIITKQFWKQYAKDQTKGLAIYETISKIVILFAIGIILLILSGVTMMAITHGAFGEQTWFRIKFGLVVIIIINGLANGRRLGIKLRKKYLSAGIAWNNNESGLFKIRFSLRLFHFSQMLLFIIIFILSVFKFN
ncbi:hypothetical protein ACX0G9_24100 [Flavitalea flava]